MFAKRVEVGRRTRTAEELEKEGGTWTRSRAGARRSALPLDFPRTRSDVRPFAAKEAIKRLCTAPDESIARTQLRHRTNKTKMRLRLRFFALVRAQYSDSSLSLVQ